MEIRLHPHALQRLKERGTNEEEIIATVQYGERFPAKFDRIGFRRNFHFTGKWHGRRYAVKQVEVFAVEENGWLVLTVITKYF